MTMAQMERQVPTLGMYPFGSLRNEVETEKECPFIVDIGGERGQALLAIQEEAPVGFGAKMILQDRPDVIGSLAPEDISNIETVVYDFFTPQPISSLDPILNFMNLTHVKFKTLICIFSTVFFTNSTSPYAFKF